MLEEQFEVEDEVEALVETEVEELVEMLTALEVITRGLQRCREMMTILTIRGI